MHPWLLIITIITHRVHVGRTLRPPIITIITHRVHVGCTLSIPPRTDSPRPSPHPTPTLTPANPQPEQPEAPPVPAIELGWEGCVPGLECKGGVRSCSHIPPHGAHWIHTILPTIITITHRVHFNAPHDTHRHYHSQGALWMHPIGHTFITIITHQVHVGCTLGYTHHHYHTHRVHVGCTLPVGYSLSS